MTDSRESVRRARGAAGVARDGVRRLAPTQAPAPSFAVASLLALALCLVMTMFPDAAHATYADVADSFPAAQDLGDYGAPIYGDQLPDGMYKIAARTSSRMCIMYTNPADAEARDSKEQAIVSVEGGSMTVLFYISKAYTHLYMGTQEEAAAATNEDGTDASAYIAGDPDEGYVPHLFALPISALNVPMTMATFSGGDRGAKSGRWYTRQVVFAMSESELQEAIADAGGSGQQGEGQAAADAEAMIAALPDADAVTLADEPAVVAARAAYDALADDQKALVSNASKLQALEARLEELRQAASAEAAALAAGNGNNDGDEGASEGAQPEELQEPDPDPEPEPAPLSEPDPEPVPAAANVTRGVPMHVAGVETLRAAKAMAAEPADQPQPEVPVMPLVLVSGLVLALAAGFVARIVLFARAYEGRGDDGRSAQ